MEKSVFLEREGHAPKNRVLDFLIIAQDFDYSLKDIARFSNISYPCMKQLKKELVKDGWIVQTRKVGKAQMYKLNISSKKVEKFVEFFWTVVNEEVEKEIGINKTHSHSAAKSIAMPVCARNA